MERALTKTSTVFSRAAYAVFLLLIAATAVVGFRDSLTSDWKGILLCAILALAVGVPALYGAGTLAQRLGARKSLLILLGLCFAVKLAWVLAYSIEPESDYLNFYNVAVEMMESEPPLERAHDFAVFPHILGYAWFLSLFMRVFGTGLLVPALLNVALSVVSAAAIFYLGNKLGGLRMAAAATLLWSVCPSQTIYNMFVLSEPLYTALILLFLCLVVWLSGKEKLPWYGAAGLGAAGGLLLAGINAARPIAAILPIGLVLWLGLLRMKDWREKDFRRKWLAFPALLLAAWMLFGTIWNSYLTKWLVEELPSIPGYNVYVGLNPDSNGTWNVEDDALLQAYKAEPGATAVSVQEKLMEDAKERLGSGDVDLLYLLGQKLRGLLWKDSVCVHYARSVLTHTSILNYLCNGFYHAVMLLSFAAAVLLLKRGDRSLLFLPMVFIIGLTMAQLLVEVAGRYHYSIVPMFCLLGAWFVSTLSSERWKKKHSGQGA